MGALVKAEQQTAAADHQQYLTFVLSGEMYAIAILSVKEIIEYGNLTVVPMMPDCIRGVINLRGAVVPVVDLARRFSSGTTELSRRSCIIIIEVEANGEQQDIGAIVDAVSEVLEIREDQIEPPPAFGAKIRTDFIQGMGKIEGRFVILLNVNRMLSMDDLSAMARTTGIGQESLEAA